MSIISLATVCMYLSNVTPRVAPFPLVRLGTAISSEQREKAGKHGTAVL